MQSASVVGCDQRLEGCGIDDHINANLAGRLDFVADEPGLGFVGDITYVKTWAGWLYLATVIDLYSREVVGCSMASHTKEALVVDAMRMAVRNDRVNAKGAVFHSDRSQPVLFRYVH